MGSALLVGQEAWSTDYLGDRDPRYRAAWDVARLIPGWCNEVNAAALFQVAAEIGPRQIVEFGSEPAGDP